MALSATPRRLALLRGGPSEAAGDPPGCTVRGPGRGASAARGRSGPRSSCGGNESVSSGTDGPGGQAPPRTPLLPPVGGSPSAFGCRPGGAGACCRTCQPRAPPRGAAARPGASPVCGLPHEPLNPDTKVSKEHCSSCCPSVQNPPRGSSSPRSPVCLCSATPAHTVTAFLILLQFVQPNCPLRLSAPSAPCLGPRSHPRCWKCHQPRAPASVHGDTPRVSPRPHAAGLHRAQDPAVTRFAHSSKSFSFVFLPICKSLTNTVKKSLIHQEPLI